VSIARTLAKLAAFQSVGIETMPYGNEAGTFTNARQALDWIFSALYPNTQDSVATVGDLPLVGNTLNDYRVVTDDGDGKAAGYRWEQREGEASPSWHKIHDMDWSSDAILAALTDKTNELYVSKYGRQDLDDQGDPVTGIYAGQKVYGGAVAGENLTLNPNSGDGTGPQSGYVQFDGHTRPTDDDLYDLGTATERFRDLFLAGELNDGTVSIPVSDIVDAFLHSQVTSGNPHAVSYDELTTTLGTLTLDGDVSGSADLSASGNKTLTVTVANDSHTHDAASTITNFDTEVYNYLKTALVDNTEVTWVFDDGLEEIEAQISITTGAIDDVADPAADKILVGKPDGTEWIASSGLIELTGDATGSAAYDSSTDKWSIATTVASSSLEGINEVDINNKTFSASAANPSVITATGHGLRNGEAVTIFGSGTTPSIDGTHTITYIDANSFTIPVNVTVGSASGYYIPQGAQLLWYPADQKFKVAKEYEEIRLGELSGLTEDVLSIYVAKDGRTGGQTVNGGVAASEDLTLDSTAHATKGSILVGSKITPVDTAAYSGGWSGTDIGSATKKWNDLYMAGEAKGLRAENVGAIPTSSGTTVGRLVYYSGNLYHDNGSSYNKVGSGDLVVQSKSADYTALITDDVILMSASGGSCTVTLPAAATATKALTVKKTDASANTVTIDGSGSETIDGSLTQVLDVQYRSFKIVSDGSNWYMI
jgi:hypothetical protein